ncbi:MAG: hypothetical protein ACTS8R_04585 [Arsenophonus sp. NC-QC1-MAG3]
MVFLSPTEYDYRSESYSCYSTHLDKWYDFPASSIQIDIGFLGPTQRLATPPDHTPVKIGYASLQIALEE